MLRVALNGYGFMGKMHSSSYQAMPTAELACIIDVEADKRAEAEKDRGVKAYSTLAAALAAETFEIVDVTLPTYLHAGATVAALEAGKHVICEKPMALDVAECRSMIDAQRSAGRKLMIAHVLRFWPEYAKLKALVDSGKYGKPKSVVCTRLGAPPLWSWTNWLMEEPRSGGALIDLHVHDIDWVCYMLGRPKAVFATGRHFDARGGFCHVLANYVYDGVAALAEGGWDLASAWGFFMGCRVVCEDAVIDYASSASPPLRVFAGSDSGPTPVEVPQVEVEGQAAGGNISSLGGYYLECEYFAKCVAEGTEPTVVTPAQAMQNIEVAQAEIESLKTGRVVGLPQA